MAAGDKPRIKVAVKPKDGGTRISVLAAWEREDGKLSASLDKRVVELALKLDDGTIVRVKRGADGKPTHWIDVFDEALNAPAPRAAARAQPRAAAGGAAPANAGWDFGGDDTDDLPFAIDATLYGDGRDARRDATCRVRLR